MTADILDQITAMTRCRRCQCRACGRAGAGELHDHVCTGDAAEGDGWLPISGAPKDGTAVLLHDAVEPTSYFVEVGFFGPTNDGTVDGDCDEACWRTSWDHSDLREFEPTHWMPLPPPPSSARESGCVDTVPRLRAELTRRNLVCMQAADEIRALRARIEGCSNAQS